MLHPRNALLIAAVFILTIGAAQAAKAADLPDDLCSLLPASDVTKILGQAFQPPEKSVAPNPYRNTVKGTDCHYASKSAKLWLRVYADPSPDDAKNLFAKLGMFYSPQTPVAGLGDEAYFDRDHALHVRKGRVRFYLNLDPVTSSTEKQLKDLAASLISRL